MKEEGESLAVVYASCVVFSLQMYAHSAVEEKVLHIQNEGRRRRRRGQHSAHLVPATTTERGKRREQNHEHEGREERKQLCSCYTAYNIQHRAVAACVTPSSALTVCMCDPSLLFLLLLLQLLLCPNRVTAETHIHCLYNRSRRSSTCIPALLYHFVLPFPVYSIQSFITHSFTRSSFPLKPAAISGPHEQQQLCRIIVHCVFFFS